MIHICVRSTVDWSDEAAFRHHLWPAMVPKVATWDATFRLSWREFRVATSAIARSNLAQVAGAVVTPWDEVPDGHLVLPVDDDDWFAPDLLAWLVPADDGQVEGVVWQQAVLEVPINLGHRLFLLRRRLFSTPPRWYCATNNYAIRKGPLGHEEWGNHTRADARFRGHPAVPFVPRILSLHNRSLASATSMGWRKPSVSRHELLAKYRAYLRLYARYQPASDDAAWTVPYVHQMLALMEGLGPR